MHLPISIILIFSVAPFFSASQSEPTCCYEISDLEIIPYRRGDCWGYADTSGKIVIAPVFEEAGVFHSGRGRIRQNGLYGFIDHSGNMVIEPKFIHAKDFEWQHARVNLEGKGMTIDRMGIAVHKLPVDRCLGDVSVRKHFNIYRKEGKFGAISKVFARDANSCKIATIIDTIPAVYDAMQENHHGIAAVRSGKKWGVINTSGALILPFDFDSIVFRAPWPIDGGAFYYGKIRQGNKWGFIDSKGKLVVPPKYESVDWFEMYIARVKPFGAPPGYIDTQGREYFHD